MSGSSAPRLALGIDIGGTSVKAALHRGTGSAIWTGQSSSYSKPTLETLVGKIRTLLGSMPQHAEPIASVGICAPGLVDPASNTIVRALNMPCLVGQSLDGVLGAALPAGFGELPRMRTCTDAHAAAHDFWCSSVPALTGRLLALSLGTGIGAAVLDPPDATPLIVSGLGPGHLGQMDTGLREPGADHASDGSVGTLEAFMGLPALRARFGPELGTRVRELDVREVPLAALVRAVRVAHSIYRPQHVALLGGVGLQLSGKLGDLRGAISDGLTTLARTDWTLSVGRSTFHAASGAARLSVLKT